MLKQAAWEFGRALAELSFTERVCSQLSTYQIKPELEQDTRSKVQDVLGNLKRICILSDLDDAIGPELDRFQEALARESLSKLSQRCNHLRYRIQDELQSEFYFQVDRQDVRFYDRPDLFGSAVTAKFPKAADDIRRAGNCIALQQPDACIFHLMRALEVAVQQLSRRLGIPVTHKTTWRVLTGNMDDKIKKMPEKTPNQKEKKDKWSEARANLHQVGQVWRNKTMHPAVSYSRGQARDVFDAVRVFMSALALL